MPLFTAELPEIGKPFVAINRTGDDCAVYVRVKPNLYKDAYGDTQMRSDETFDNDHMQVFYNEWLYCDTLPQFLQDIEDEGDYVCDYRELKWEMDRDEEFGGT